MESSANIMKSEHSFSNMCRLCLSWNGDSMPSIFDSMKNDNSVLINDVINTLTDISIREGDGLPERICNCCLIFIERIIEFKQLCEQTDNSLRKFLLSLNGLNGHKTNVEIPEAGKENKEQKKEENSSVYSSISKKISVESEIMVVDPSVSVMDDNQNEIFEDWSVEHSIFKEDPVPEFVSATDYSNEYENNDDENEVFGCDSCNKSFHSKKWLERHMLLHTDTPPFPCDYCFRVFASLTELYAHWQEHAGSRHFCETCGEAFETYSDLVEHIPLHEQPFQCETCVEGFLSISELQDHMHTHTTKVNLNIDDKSSAHMCTVCDKAFARGSNLRKHVRAMHSGFRPHRCSTCGKTFPCKSDLARHTSTHTGERPFTCELCLYSFSRKDKLFRHMRTHSNDRPFSCQLCPCRFKWKDKLIRHMRTHMDTQLHLYKCKVCPSSFKTRGELNKHSISHTQPVVYLNRLKVEGSSEKTSDEIKIES